MFMLIYFTLQGCVFSNNLRKQKIETQIHILPSLIIFAETSGETDQEQDLSLLLD